MTDLNNERISSPVVVLSCLNLRFTSRHDDFCPMGIFNTVSTAGSCVFWLYLLCDYREYFTHFGISDYYAFVDAIVASDVETMDGEEKRSWIYDYCMKKYSFDSCSLLRLSLATRYFSFRLCNMQGVSSQSSNVPRHSNPFHGYVSP